MFPDAFIVQSRISLVLVTENSLCNDSGLGLPQAYRNTCTRSEPQIRRPALNQWIRCTIGCIRITSHNIRLQCLFHPNTTNEILITWSISKSICKSMSQIRCGEQSVIFDPKPLETSAVTTNNCYQYRFHCICKPITIINMQKQQQIYEYSNRKKINSAFVWNCSLIVVPGHPVNNLHGMQGSGVSDLSNDSSPTHGYPDFPPSPDSWLGESVRSTHPSSAPAGDYS